MIVGEDSSVLAWPPTHGLTKPPSMTACTYIFNEEKQTSTPFYTTTTVVNITEEQQKQQQCVKPEHMTLSYVSSIMDNKKKKKKKVSLSKSDSKRRTVTSYDRETSLYLKSVFFEVYSYQKKLTKQQRKEVQKKTGLASRNITYWFSNHKRRFHQTLQIYRDAVENSNGKIKNYKDFLLWRQKNGLPDQISPDELL